VNTLATIAFAICSLSAFVVVYLAMRGLQNTYVFFVEPERVLPGIQDKTLRYVIVPSFVLGCVFTLI
jgi:hypothetical protein